MNPYGITEKSFRLVLETLSGYPQVKSAVLFGSRAKGNPKKGSDIDLAIKGEHCTAGLALSLQSYLNEELPIPYMIDVVDYHSLAHRELKAHIDRVGVEIYRREADDLTYASP